MDWNLAIEKNHGALKRILAVLLAMVRMFGDEPKTLPRHLHRYVLSLLRPAESATRRLIVIAARGLVVKRPKPRAEKNGQRPPRPDPRIMPEWARLRLEHCLPIEFPRGEPIPLWAQQAPKRERPATAPRAAFFPMFDPVKRVDRSPDRQRLPDAQMPRIVLPINDGRLVPLHDSRPASPPPPPPRAPDDPLDATRIHRRLEMIGAALDDLPRQAERFARWRALRDARLARERGTTANEFTPTLESSPQGRGNSPLREGIRGGSRYPHERGAGGVHLKRRFSRIELLRPGHPPGWRRRPTHEVHEVLNDLHGLAVRARDGP
jgi:hypothetical protein